jgi:DMSO/TMAO reductase YedYZ molybdopterin-dependent catalytic subunit
MEINRRKFLSYTIGGAVGLALPYAFYRYIESGVEAALPVDVANYLKYGSQAALHAITANADFYLTSSQGEPAVDAAKWSLAVDGLVEEPLRFDYEQVRGLPPYEADLTLECISNSIGGSAIGNARWRGTRLRPLLDRARVKPNAVYAVLHAADGYSTGIPISRFLRPENFLAYEMNGEPLPRRHGYPLRIFIPGKFGMKQPKWLTRIEFIDREYLGYWEQQGWSNDAERHLAAVIDSPRDGARLADSRTTLFGYAVSNESGVSRVEVSTDAGRTWQAADIFSNPSPQVWAFWKYDWARPARGKHTLQARATDGQGRIQTAARSGSFPSGATGYHTLSVTIA